MFFNLFSFLNTTNYSFEGKKEGEKVIIFLHRHWYILVSKFVFLFVAAFLPLLVIAFFGKVLISLQLIPLFTCLWAFYYMLLWYALFYSLTMYTLDMWIVTNIRIINSVQRGFFNRIISELPLDKVQDISFHIEGAIPTFLKFGDITVQTAGTERHFTFEEIPNPQGVKEKIMELVSIRQYELENEFEAHLRAKL